MTYSLVSAASLGFDLVRLPCGEQVARVLLDALHATDADLQRLADAHPGQGRRLRWQQVRCLSLQQSVRDTLRLAGPVLTLAAEGEQHASTAVLRRLELAPLGDLDALERLIRHDVLDWTWSHADDVATQPAHASQAADVLVDAAASAYCADALVPAQRRELVVPYLSAGRAAASDDDSDLDPSLLELLDVIGTPSPANRDAWRRAADEQRTRTNAWAPAMHQATWAVHLSGRLRTTAASQLQAVLAFRRAGFTGQDGSYGVWNAISGVVQGYTVRDLVSEADLAVLVRPYVLAMGAPPAGI